MGLSHAFGAVRLPAEARAGVPEAPRWSPGWPQCRRGPPSRKMGRINLECAMNASADGALSWTGAEAKQTVSHCPLVMRLRLRGPFGGYTGRSKRQIPAQMPVRLTRGGLPPVHRGGAVHTRGDGHRDESEAASMRDPSS